MTPMWQVLVLYYPSCKYSKSFRVPLSVEAVFRIIIMNFSYAVCLLLQIKFRTFSLQLSGYHNFWIKHFLINMGSFSSEIITACNSTSTRREMRNRPGAATGSQSPTKGKQATGQQLDRAGYRHRASLRARTQRSAPPELRDRSPGPTMRGGRAEPRRPNH